MRKNSVRSGAVYDSASQLARPAMLPLSRRAQVKSLYGPLLACITTSQSAFTAMLKQHSPDGTRLALVAAIRDNPAGEEGIAYRCGCAPAALRSLRRLSAIPHLPFVNP